MWPATRTLTTCLALLLCEVSLTPCTAEPGQGLRGGGPILPELASGAQCISHADEQRVLDLLQEYERQHGPISRAAVRGQPPQRYPFFPMAGTLYGDLFTNNFVDLNPSGAILDWDCTNFTYDGHQGIDVDLRSFGEQFVGVPVFAALDGTVVATDDGHFDMRTSVVPGAQANFVIIDHGEGRLAYYWHLKNGSVAVSTGQQVKRGQQIGLAASSGFSTQPHLHFETRINGVVSEPYVGPCRPGDSGWENQTPIDRSLYLRDFGITYENLNLYPGWPAEFPRSGQLALNDPLVYYWMMPCNLPPFSTWRVRFRRPNGTIAFDSGTNSFNNPQSYRWSWWWFAWNITDMHSITGTWTLLIDLNGQRMVDAPVEVRTVRTADFNRPPIPIAVSLDPVNPMPEDAVFCRVSTDLVLDDLDYDLLAYRYVWEVNGVEVRDVITAAHSDAIPGMTAEYGDTIICTVTPGDGTADGPSAVATTIITCPGDANGDNIVNLPDLNLVLGNFQQSGAPGIPGDLNADGIVNNLDLNLVLGNFASGCS